MAPTRGVMRYFISTLTEYYHDHGVSLQRCKLALEQVIEWWEGADQSQPNQ